MVPNIPLEKLLNAAEVLKAIKDDDLVNGGKPYYSAPLEELLARIGQLAGQSAEMSELLQQSPASKIA